VARHERLTHGRRATCRKANSFRKESNLGERIVRTLCGASHLPKRCPEFGLSKRLADHVQQTADGWMHPERRYVEVRPNALNALLNAEAIPIDPGLYGLSKIVGDDA